ncbi:MAG: hypothetical protein D3926_20770 [Desulfobacteraceae bacterium]|nr:MAG: hypothetical protein D3926_20770 [Desulfobacteraceae bacterium]
MSSIIVLLIAVGIIIGVILFLRSQKKGAGSVIQEAAQTLAQASPASEPAPENEYRQILDSLLALNILIRKDPDLDEAILEKLEAIIDDLRVVIPQMMERYPSETLTYEIKKIGQQHFYKTVKEFMDLSLESRAHQLDIFTKTIDNLSEVSKRSRAIVEKNETAEFKTMANFLSTKFS